MQKYKLKIETFKKQLKYTFNKKNIRNKNIIICINILLQRNNFNESSFILKFILGVVLIN